MLGNNTPRLGGADAPEADLSQYADAPEINYNRFGWRVGMESMTPSVYGFMGAFYRLELGQLARYTPSSTATDDISGRFYLLATVGFNFYPNKPAQYSIPK